MDNKHTFDAIYNFSFDFNKEQNKKQMDFDLAKGKINLFEILYRTLDYNF